MPTDLRFIFLGKELLDAEVLENIAARCTADLMTIHLVIRERNVASPGNTPLITPTIHYAGSPAVRVRKGPLIADDSSVPSTEDKAQSDPAIDGDEEEEEEAPVHFHAVTVSEKELSQFRQIFDRKKGSNGRVALNTVRAVLLSYWSFIHREGFEPDRKAFPEQRLSQLVQKLQSNDGLSLDEFLVVFYLFDNEAAEEPCIHGEQERVRVACAQLHSVIQGSHEFYHEKFEDLFGLVCSDENQKQLTCKEMELLYYMYSCHVLEQVRETELVAKVQAIVRMRIQASKYSKMVGAARRVQNAWRLRMFTSDRHNHERIADFLKIMLHGPEKVGGPRI